MLVVVGGRAGGARRRGRCGLFGANALALADVPDDFVEETAFDGLQAPASIEFSPDGRVFVGQLNGVIQVYDSLDDPTPRVYADLTDNVLTHTDRGLLGMVLDPQFTTGRPYIYVTYTYDAAIGGTAPRWNDFCPDPPGAEGDGCIASGRLSKILPDGTEIPLIKDEWCQQYASHSLGDLHFGLDGALYVTAGDGASYTFADYGQDGAPRNPCGDTPQPVGGAMTPPSAEGGALRSQDARTSADPTGLDGTMIRIDPDTGASLPRQSGHGRSQRAADRRLRLPQPVPLGVQAGDQRRLRGRCRLARLGRDQPGAQRRVPGPQLRVALLRGRRPPECL